MAIIEGSPGGAVAEVGAVAASPLHVVTLPMPVGAGGSYRLSMTSGTMAAALTANSEIFQFRFVTAASRVALIHRVSISAGANVAATAAALLSFNMTAARSWTVAGSGGTRATLTGNNGKMRTSQATSEVNDAGISTTGALTGGTKTLDTANIGGVSYGVGTGAITTSLPLNLIPQTDIFTDDAKNSFPLVLANQEGFVIRSGIIGPAGMTWAFTVTVEWSEVPAF